MKKRKKFQEKMEELNVSEADGVEKIEEKRRLKIEKIQKKGMEQRVKQILNLTINCPYYEAYRLVLIEKKIPLNPMFESLFEQ